MGIINLATAGAKTGLGLFKTEAKCFFYAGTLLQQTGGDSLVNAVVFKSSPAFSPPSNVPRAYEGSHIVIFGVAADALTGVAKVSSRCTVARYILVAQLTTALPAGSAAASITVRGGKGSLGGDDSGINGFSSTAAISANTIELRFGVITAAAQVVGGVQMPSDAVLTGIAAGGVDGTDTVLTVTPFTPSSTVPAGTSVFVGISGEFHLARLEACTSTASQSSSDTPFDIVPTAYQAPACPAGGWRQLSTLTAYYGGVADDAGDSGCAAECAAAGGCDPAAGRFGAGVTCVSKWGSGRVLQDPDREWRVVAVRATGNELQAYVDGLHDGCAVGSGPCTVTPPVSITGTAVSLQSLRIGLMDAEGNATQDFASMDVAEMLVYNKALTAPEMDRIGNYLATKFGLGQFRLNRYARSLSRAVALSRSPGCGDGLQQREAGRFCDGLAASACGVGATRATLSSAADPSDGYYVGRRLTVTGGGGSTDSAGISSSAGQTCLITAYTGSSRVAECDFTSLGAAYLLWSGPGYPPPPGYDAVTAFHTNLTVTWAPAVNPPFYALLGDPAGPRAVVRVLSVRAVDAGHQLLVEQAAGGTVRSPVAARDTRRLDGHPANTITYARAHVPGDPVAGGYLAYPGAASLLASHFAGYAPVSVASNWRAKVSSPTSAAGSASEAVQVVSAAPVTFTLSAILSAGVTTASLTADTPFGTLAAGDLLQLGSLLTAEVVEVAAACDVGGSPTGGGASGVACTITRWMPVASQATVSAGTAITRVGLSRRIIPPLASFTLTAALAAADTALSLSADTGFVNLAVGDLLLVGSEVIYIGGACTTSCTSIQRGQSAALWAAATDATQSAQLTTAASASAGSKAYLVGRQKGSPLSAAVDVATLSFTVANTGGLSLSAATVTLTSASPSALQLLASGDYLKVGSELLALSGPCAVSGSASQVAVTCTNYPTCPSTGCTCGVCPVSRAQLGSSAAAAAAAATATVAKVGTTFADPVALNLFHAFALRADLYPDGGSGGASGVVTLVGDVPAVSCTSAGTGYSTLPLSVAIGQNGAGASQPSTCDASFAAAEDPVGSARVTVTVTGGASSASGAGCLAGTFNLVFFGGSGHLAPGACTVTFPPGTHTATISPTGGGYSAAPEAHFKTGSQPRGCAAASVGGIAPAGGALPGSPSPTVSSADGCLLGAAGTAQVLFLAPAITPAYGTYSIPGDTPALSPGLGSEGGSGYVVDTANVSVTPEATLTASSACLVTFALAAGSAAGTLKLTIAGASIAGNGAGCVIDSHTISFVYSGAASPPPTPPTLALQFPDGAPTFSGDCSAMPCSAVGTANTSDTLTITLGPSVGNINGVSVSQPATCLIAITAANNAAKWDVSMSGASSTTSSGCIIGTFSLVFSLVTSGGGFAPSFTITIPAAAPAYNLGTCSSNVCDDLGANYVVLPSAFLGIDLTTSMSQPSSCVVSFTVALGTTPGKVLISAMAGSSSSLGVGCLIGTYSVIFSGGIGSAAGVWTIAFTSGTITTTLGSGGANYPARPRVAMGGQPNSCQGTADSGLTFTSGTGELSSATAATFGGTLTGCLIEGSAVSLNLDIGTGQVDPAFGTYTITAGSVFGTASVSLSGFGYNVMPLPSPPSAGTGGQSATCTLTSVTTSTVLSGSQVPTGGLLAASALPLAPTGCTNGTFSLVFAKPRTYSLAITSDTPYPVSSLKYNDLLLVGREVVRLAGACTSATPPVCPVIRGQQSTTPMLHGSGARTILLQKAPSLPASAPITFTLTAASAAGGVALTMTADTWFPASSLSYGDTLLVNKIIFQIQDSCTSSGGVFTCGTVGRGQAGTTDDAVGAGNSALLLPATAITFRLTSSLGLTADGRLQSLSISSDQASSVAVADLKAGDMLLINAEVVQLSADCSSSPCTVVRAKGGTLQAAAAVGDKAVMVRRQNRYSLTAPITFQVSNVLGLASGDSTVTLAASTNFPVSSLAAGDVLLVVAEFLQLSGACTVLGECPVTRGASFAGATSTAVSASQNAVATLIRRPSHAPPASADVTFTLAATFRAWGLVGLGDCPGSAATGCGSVLGCQGSCPSTPTFGSTLLSLTADTSFGVGSIAEHDLLMVGTELVRVAGPCHPLGCPVQRAQQHSDYLATSLGYSLGSTAVLVTGPAITFAVSNSAGLATGAATVTMTADTAFNVALLMPNDLLLVGSEVLRVTSLGCTIASTPANSFCGVDRGQLTPLGIATEDPGSTYILGTKLTYLGKALLRGYSPNSGVQVDLAYVPQPTTVTSKAFVGGSGVSTYTIEGCDPTATPASRAAPIETSTGGELFPSQWDAGAAQLASGGGTSVEIKGWDLLPSDLDIVSDGAITFTLSAQASIGSTSLTLTADSTAFPVQSLEVNDFLFVGTEILQISAAAPAGSGPSTPAVVTVSRAQSTTVAAVHAAGSKAMRLARVADGSTTTLKTFTIAAATFSATSITFTAAGTLVQGDLLLEPTIGEVIRITSTGCSTLCNVERGQPTPLGVATAAGLTSTALIFLKRPAQVAPGPVAFVLASTPLASGDLTVTLTSTVDPIVFTVAAGALSGDTALDLTADSSFPTTSLTVGDMLLIGSEVVAVAVTPTTSSPYVVVSRSQNSAAGVITVAATISAGAKAVLLDSAYNCRRLLGRPRSGFAVSSLTDGDLLAIGSELVRVTGPCGVNQLGVAPDALDVCPIQRAQLGTSVALTVAAGPAALATVVQRALIDDNKLARTNNYLLVTIGPPAAAGSGPGSLSATVAQETRLPCAIRSTRAGSCANDWFRACRCSSGVMCPDCRSNAVCRSSIDTGVNNMWPYRSQPSLHCVLPHTVGPDQNLNIYFHGVRTTLSDWYRPDPPEVHALTPAYTSRRGGDVVTITGRNFGTAPMWARGALGPSAVELLGGTFVSKCSIAYVSDTQLLCTVPPLPLLRQTAASNLAGTVVDVVVRAAGRRSARTAQSRLTCTDALKCIRPGVCIPARY